MNSLFNSPFEMELRVLLLLYKVKMACTTDRILAFDFIACYAAEFHLGEDNLHGINDFKYGEIASRKELVTAAIKSLVLKGLVTVDIKDGYFFRIAEKGSVYISGFESAYALEYGNTVSQVFEAYGNTEDVELLKLIQKKSVYIEG